MIVNHLAIQLSEHAIHFVSLNNDTVLHESTLVFENDSTSYKKDILANHFSETAFLATAFDEITLSWSHKRSTLVPNLIFEDSTPNDIFELCYGKDSVKYDLDYNRISELSAINIYEIPLWIKYYFVIKFPRIIIQHEGSHIIRQNIKDNGVKLKAAVVLYDGYFQVTIVKDNNLEFYSSFDYQNHEDVIYHLMFTLQQKEMTNEEGVLEFATGPGTDSSIISKLKTDIARIGDLQKLKVSHTEHYIAKSQLLCV
ncbi:MAG: DUF3822 family protein [Crocinitomicaceae bacterium]|nr:DUF3822 family protein [Crocinitomicaceae bacterium]MDG1777427.1 DUF3822 family protein [Crocinitomicaceae bacterium]